jgi:ribosomal protein S18 acetylase RimI-like enzyme
MSMKRLAIAPFRDADHAEVVTLWRLCFPDDPPRNDPDQIIARKKSVQPELFLVGRLGDRVVCTAVAGFDGYRGWVYHLATAPDCRRQGFARELMLEVERRLSARGCPKLNLQVRKTNQAVLTFYAHLGYLVEDHTSMAKVLVPPDARSAAGRRMALVELTVGGWALAFFVTALSIQAPGIGQRWFAQSTAWSFNAAWQWEIAAFDLCLGMLMVICVRNGLARQILPVLLILGLLLGGNHLHAALTFGKPGNWVGAGANALGLLLIIASLAVEGSARPRRT